VPRIAPILLAVLVLAACGGDESGSASEDYANDVCANLSTWVADVEQSVRSLTDQGLSVSRDDIQSAFDETKDATDSMVNDLEQLGPPESEDGQQAKSELDQLATELREQMDAIQQAIDSGGGVAAIAGQVAASVSAAANAVKSTFESLRVLDPPGEVRDAFENAEECNSLREQLENIRSR
jgi:hypothetical protein